MAISKTGDQRKSAEMNFLEAEGSFKLAKFLSKTAPQNL
jgi:hypothetical protein